jgi:hypothetical protein
MQRYKFADASLFDMIKVMRIVMVSIEELLQRHPKGTEQPTEAGAAKCEGFAKHP